MNSSNPIDFTSICFLFLGLIADLNNSVWIGLTILSLNTAPSFKLLAQLEGEKYVFQYLWIFCTIYLSIQVFVVRIFGSCLKNLRGKGDVQKLSYSAFGIVYQGLKRQQVQSYFYLELMYLCRVGDLVLVESFGRLIYLVFLLYIQEQKAFHDKNTLHKLTLIMISSYGQIQLKLFYSNEDNHQSQNPYLDNYSIENIMHSSSPSKRPISAVHQSQFSRHVLHEAKRSRQQVCHSENLNNSEISRASKKLPYLLLKLKLEELGFRSHQYNQYVNSVDDIEVNRVPEIAFEIVNNILNQPRPILQPGMMSESGRHPLMVRMNSSDRNRHQQSPENIACSVCYQECQKGNFVDLECEHRFCKECLSSHIKNSIEEAKYQITCLQYQCETKLLDEVIKQLIPQAIYKRYHYFKRKKEVEKNPNNKFCSVPNCEGILEQKQQLYLCPECKADYCLNCIRPKHEGNCSTKIQEIIDRSYQDYNIKKCPNCRAPIQKMDGCNHMSCKNCSYQFCWLCLGKYTKYHYRYFNCCGCPGMQFENQQDRCCQRLKQLCVFIILPPILLLIVLTVATLLPFYIIAMMFIKPVQKAMQFECLSQCCSCSCHSCKDCIDDDDSDCECCVDCCSENKINVAHFFVGMLMLPYGVLYGVTIAPIKFFIHVYDFVLEILE